MDYILQTEGLSKEYGKHRVLDHVSVHVAQGDIYGLVGRNGAGKTTLMKIITQQAHATEGTFTFYGGKFDDKLDITSRMGMLIESPGLYPSFTAEQNLIIKCKTIGADHTKEPGQLLELVGLANVGKKKVSKFSFGMKQRLGLALALVGSPDIVILDEPINGLDPQGISDIREIIKKQNHENGTTFIISSHILDELSKVATRYGFINNGVLVEESTTEDLEAKCESRIELVTSNPALASTVLDRLGISKYRMLAPDRLGIYEQLDRTGDITLALAAENVATLEIIKKYESLENYYINLVGKEEG